MQIIGGIFLTLGVGFIAAEKVEWHKSLRPSSVHAVVGVLTIISIITQIVSGMQKLEYLDITGVRIRRWHGDAGLLVWDLCCFSILTGCLQFLPFHLFHIIVYFLVSVLWLMVVIQNNRKTSDECQIVVTTNISTNNIAENMVPIDDLSSALFVPRDSRSSSVEGAGEFPSLVNRHHSSRSSSPFRNNEGQRN